MRKKPILDSVNGMVEALNKNLTLELFINETSSFIGFSISLGSDIFSMKKFENGLLVRSFFFKLISLRNFLLQEIIFRWLSKAKAMESSTESIKLVIWWLKELMF